MQNPYRRPHTKPEAVTDELKAGARWDDRILAIVLLLLAGPRVVIAFATHEKFGAEATVAAIAACLGVLLLLAGRRR